MVLTQQQESLIMRYLRDVAAHLDKELPENLRGQWLIQLKDNLYRELDTLRKNALEDTEIQAVINRFGSPATQAAQLAHRRDPSRELTLDIRHRVWLGVCAGIALRLGLEPWAVRTFAVFLGITGPLALIAYLAVYLFLYATTGPYAGPPIVVHRVLFRSVGVVGAALLLHGVGIYGVRLIYYIHEEALHRPLPPLGNWAWITIDAPEMFFWILVCAAPLAALSAMPLANAWDYSLKRLSQALLALYGIAISFGIASVIVGILLNTVEEFTG